MSHQCPAFPLALEGSKMPLLHLTFPIQCRAQLLSADALCKELIVLLFFPFVITYLIYPRQNKDSRLSHTKERTELRCLVGLFYLIMAAGHLLLSFLPCLFQL
jgi:hypothetical protein